MFPPELWSVTVSMCRGVIAGSMGVHAASSCCGSLCWEGDDLVCVGTIADIKNESLVHCGLIAGVIFPICEVDADAHSSFSAN